MSAISLTNPAVERILRHLLAYGQSLSANLLVIEPSPEDNSQYLVSYRLPDNSQSNFLLPTNLGQAVLTALKEQSKINNRQREGQFTFIYEDQPVYYQVTALAHAKLVLQPINSQPLIVPAHSLGWETPDFELLKQTVMSGQGLVIFLGPRLSGKTSSIYSILNTIKSPQLNITTIEDQPKLRLSDINQIQRQYKVDINQLLRSVATTDPDIIYLNHLDSDLDLSLLTDLTSSKLVILRLQADSLLSALQQLSSLANYDSAIWPRTKLLVNQRLVKKNCAHCLVKGKLDYYTLDDLHNQFELDDTRALRQLDFYQGQGCLNCGHSGYAGQQALFELLPMSEDLATALTQNNHKTKLQDLISQSLATSLFEDAFLKAAKGQTSISQIQALF